MRHRIKKIPTIKHLLHSDKSAYFHKNKGILDGLRSHLFLGPLRAARPSLRPYERGVHRRQECGRFSHYIAPICVSNALLLVLGMLIFPVGIVGSGEKVYAETINYPAVEGNNNAASISFTLNDKDIDGTTVSTEVKPDEISYISNSLKVTTSNIGKFAITIQSASDNGNLVNSDNGAIIAPITSATTPGNFDNNTWGYALSDETSKEDSELTYNPLPAFQETPTAQYNKEKPDDGNYNLKLVFAAKIGSNKPAGHYQTTALVSVVAEAKELITPTTPLNDWNKLEYMQQMTPTACSGATSGASKQLIDSRDSKTYWVTKMGDGQCWMTQNLDLDLSTSKALTPDDSNVKANWTPTENTQTSARPSFGVTNNNIKSWDPGYKYYADGTTQTNSNEALAKDTTGQTNAHYLQGNYYSWVAAMAGNTTGNTNESSICPKGWQLPLSNNGANAKTFQALTSALGTTSGTNTGSSDAKLLAAPSYFVRGGVVDNTSLVDSGNGGFYWSSTPDGSSHAYVLYFGSRSVSPSNNYSRCLGYSVRCVAQ